MWLKLKQVKLIFIIGLLIFKEKWMLETSTCPSDTIHEWSRTSNLPLPHTNMAWGNDNTSSRNVWIIGGNVTNLTASATQDASWYFSNALKFNMDTHEWTQHVIRNMNRSYLFEIWSHNFFTIANLNKIIVIGAWFPGHPGHTRPLEFDMKTLEYSFNDHFRPPIDDLKNGSDSTNVNLFHPCIYHNKTGGLVYLIGGVFSNDSVSDKVYIYSLITNTWSHGPSLLVPRMRHACGCIQSRLYVYILK